MSSEIVSEMRFKGCLLGGAVGDAWGTPILSMSPEQKDARYGPTGITAYLPAYGKLGAISAITQMTLFTAEGLLVARARGGDGDLDQVTAFVYQAYLRWLMTQDEVPQDQLLARHGTCSIVDGILTGFRELHARRLPDANSLAALKGGRMGTLARPINNNSGNGAVVRIAPIGLMAGEDVAFDLACAVARTTHGHPSACLAAGTLAQIIATIALGVNIATATAKAMLRLEEIGDAADDCLAMLNQALALSKRGPVSLKKLEAFSRGETAAEVLAMSLYCSLVAKENFEKGVYLAVNHSGASNCLGAVTGSLLGARGGAAAIPSRFVKPLELRALIIEMAADLHRLAEI